jgi:hypothetical protein
MSQIEAVIAAIELLEPGEQFSYHQLAKKFACSRTTLAQRHQDLASSRSTMEKTSKCNDAGKTRDPNIAWSHSEAYGSAWENRNLGSIDTYRSCTKGLQKTAYLHLGDCNVKYTKAMKC